MQLKRCPNGHYYDVEKDAVCPHCAGGYGVGDDIRTAPKAPAASPNVAWNPVDPGPTQAHGAGTGPAAGDPGPTQAHGAQAAPKEPAQDDQRTMGMMQRATGMDPVVGWLVCVEGANRGQDYRLHGERNFIGRGEKADIRLTDPSVTRETHAIVSYNPRHNIFRLMPGEGKGIVYYNGDEVLGPVDLKPYDMIELGKTKLRFIPFCSQEFIWE